MSLHVQLRSQAIKTKIQQSLNAKCSYCRLQAHIYTFCAVLCDSKPAHAATCICTAKDHASIACLLVSSSPRLLVSYLPLFLSMTYYNDSRMKKQTFSSRFSIDSTPIYLITITQREKKERSSITLKLDAKGTTAREAL
jgi:hypothetical protein